MIVYVVEKGTYKERTIVGVYASLDSAMKAFPAGQWLPSVAHEWENGLYDEELVTIYQFEVSQ